MVAGGPVHAERLAREAHRGQSDKTGAPYDEHLARVATAVSGDEAITVAWLHDIVEKGPGWTLDRLRREGFGPRIVAAVDAMTHREDEGEGWLDHVRRAGADPLAREVKRADIADNMRQARDAGLDVSRYRRGLAALAEGPVLAKGKGKHRKEQMMTMDPKEPMDDTYARDSFSMRRMAGWQLWGVTIFVVLLVALALIYMFA